MKLLLTLLSALSTQVSASDKTLSSFPHITGNTFRAISNFTLDEETVFQAHDVREPSIIFVKTDYIARFFQTIHPYLTVPYVLITHNSDCTIPYPDFNSDNIRYIMYSQPEYPLPDNYLAYLDDPKLIHWFTQNCNGSHPKLSPIPIGLANAHIVPHGDFHILESVQQRAHALEKKHLMYFNCVVETNRAERRRAAEILATTQLCYQPSFKPVQEYLEDIAASYFVVSPPGNGPDCHRTWEALLLGAIPIVKHSAFDSLFDDLPVVIVHDWTEINLEFLQKKYAELNQRTFNFEKLYAPYWIQKIKSQLNK